MSGVRKYLEKDKENLRRICVETSSFPTGSETQRNFLYYLYNDYYSECEGENCFVFTDENDEAVGYILCAEDFDRFYGEMKKTYLPRLLNLGRRYYMTSLGEIFVHRIFRKEYPAHLHIDILPAYQGVGAGTQLVGALKTHLKEKNCRGIMLSAGSSNKKAISFYKKNGFRVKVKFFGSTVMVYDF